MKKTLLTLKKAISTKAFIFIIATISMFLFSYSIDLISISGDAAETWRVAQTFFSNKKYYSYVMYKGIYAFLPSVIDIQLSSLLHIPEQFIVKLFNALCFGYIGAFGIPNLIYNIHPNKKVSTLQKYLLIALLLIFERNINYILSVDMISCTLIIALCNSAIRISRSDSIEIKHFISLGLLTGLNLCFSGQFMFSAIIASSAAIIFVVFTHFKTNGFTNYKKNGVLIAALIVFSACSIISHFPNDAYFAYVVDPARQAGEWIPNGSEWTINGLTQNFLTINYPYGIPDNLGLRFIPEDKMEFVKSNGVIYDYSSYIKLILIHPLQFLVRWSERLFLGMMNDPKNHFVGAPTHTYLWLVSMAAIIYSLYDKLKDRFKKYRDLISVDMTVYISILMSALVPSFGHVENRYFFAARSLIYGVFALSPYLNETAETIKNKIKKRTIEPISWRFAGCLIFILLSLIIYFALYQSAGVVYN